VALYDLQNDPHEDHNLAGDPARAGTVREMHRRMLEVMAADGDPMHDAFAGDPLA
jgi:arylsulfatase A-like enzyme